MRKIKIMLSAWCLVASGQWLVANAVLPMWEWCAPYVGGSGSLRWGFGLPTLGVRAPYVGGTLSLRWRGALGDRALVCAVLEFGQHGESPLEQFVASECVERIFCQSLYISENISGPLCPKHSSGRTAKRTSFAPFSSETANTMCPAFASRVDGRK